MIEIARDLPQDKGGEEESRKHTPLLDGDGHAGRAVPEGQVVAESGDTSSSLGGQSKAVFPVLHSAALVESRDNGNHHPNHPSTDRRAEARLNPVIPASTRIAMNEAKKDEPSAYWMSLAYCLLPSPPSHRLTTLPSD